MSQNVPPPQGLEPPSEVPSPAPADAPQVPPPAAPPGARPPLPPAPAVYAGDRILAVLEIFFASGLLSNVLALLLVEALFRVRPEKLAQHPEVMFYFLMADTAFMALIIAFFLRQRQERFSDLGFRTRRLGRSVASGLLMVPVLFVITGVGSYVFKTLLPDYAMSKNPMLEVIQTPRDLAFFLASGVVGGGVREELQRAFVLTRFQKYLFGAWPGLLLWSAFFGYMHFDLQGLQGAVITGLLGLCFGMVFLAQRNIYGPVVGHAVYNTISLLVFWFYSRAANGGI